MIETVGAWAHIMCSNGWTAWVDARQLQPLTSGEPIAPAGPPSVGDTLLPRILTSSVVIVTATLHGSSLVASHARFDVRDDAGTPIGSGGGLGPRDQIDGSGFAISDETGTRSLTVVPRDRDWAVTDHVGQAVGVIARAHQGLKGAIKPAVDLVCGQNIIGRISTQSVGGTRLTVTDHNGDEVATVRDTTLLGHMYRYGSCRLSITGSPPLALRQLTIAATADAAIGQMRSHNRPRRWT